MYKEIKYTGKRNGKGDPIFEGQITITNQFDIETVKARIENIKTDITNFEKSGDKVLAEVEAAKINVDINKGVLDAIKENAEITPDMASAAEILFRNMKIVMNSDPENDKKEMAKQIELMNQEIVKFEALLEEANKIEIPNEPEQSTEASSEEGSEETGTDK